MRRVYLFGNGLSLAFNEDYYSLQALTDTVRGRLARMTTPTGESLLDHLEEISAALRPDLAPARRDSFEEIAGPVDRLANTFSEFGPLVRIASQGQRHLLNELRRSLRALYKRVVGAVLESVMTHPPGAAEWDPVNQVAHHLVRKAVEQGELDVFCLNYDALLDSALLEAQSGYADRFGLMDEFQGFGVRSIEVFTANAGLVAVEALPWRWARYTPPAAPLRLHHLHGAGTWMRANDDIFKARNLEEIRSAGLFSAWADGIEGQEEDGQVEPVVILGDQKGPSVQRSPFNESYEAFATAVNSADEIVLAGTSLLDEPLNRTLAAYRRPKSRIVIVNPHEGIEDIARQALGVPPRDPLVVIHEPLPRALDFIS